MNGKQQEIPLEKDIVKKIRAHLDKQDIWNVKIHGSAFQHIGLPDLICIVHGRFVGLEVKRPKVGRITTLQQAMMEKIRKAGGIAEVVTSVDDVRKVLEALCDG